METTTLDYAILGLLLESPRTAYALRKAFEETALGNFSSSPGTIYPATKRLLKMKLVKDLKEGNATILTVTDKGKTKIKEWLTQPISQREVAKNSSLLILKFAFMDSLVPRKDKLAFLKSFAEITKNYLQILESYHKNHSLELPLHGLLSFEYGVAQFKTQLIWAKSALHKIEKLNTNV